MVGKLLLPRRLSKGSIVTGVIVPLRSMQESAIAKREHHAVLQTYDPAAQSGLAPTTQSTNRSETAKRGLAQSPEYHARVILGPSEGSIAEARITQSN
jgi:hypothetical protein